MIEITHLSLIITTIVNVIVCTTLLYILTTLTKSLYFLKKQDIEQEENIEEIRKKIVKEYKED